MTFTPAWWLRNAHAQTLWAPLRRHHPQPTRRQERLELPEGDFIDLFWAGVPTSGIPLVIAIHGLTGSAESPYIRGLQHTLSARGIASVALQLRGAGTEPNRMARMYHSGDTADLDALVRHLHACGHDDLRVAGYSLGGNVLLQWLATCEDPSPVRRAAAVSVPFLLGAVAERMNHGASRLYRNHMLGELKQTLQRKKAWAQTHAPAVYDALHALGDLSPLSRFRDYDQQVVAPLNGFADADDYYTRCSSRPRLKQIRTPTLIVHSSDDPLMTPDVAPTPDDVSPAVTLEIYRKGGHVGFVSGWNPLRPVYWLDTRIADYLTGA